MAANFFIRTIKKNGDATLFVRVRIVEKGIDIKQSTGLAVNAAEWTKAQNDAKSLFKFCSVTFLSPPVSPFPLPNRT